MALRTSTQTLLSHARTALRPATIQRTAAPPLSLARAYHRTGPLAAYKDDQDRESLKPRPSDSTKSGSDDQVAEKTDAAFNPNKTSPDEARESANDNGNPLEISGANQDVSKPTQSEEPADKSDKKTKSGGSKGKKHGKLSPM